MTQLNEAVIEDKLIFEASDFTRKSSSLAPDIDVDTVAKSLPEHLLRKSDLQLPQVGELQVVRHYTSCLLYTSPSPRDY